LPSFRLFNEIPGLEGKENTFSISGTSALVSLRLTDELLWQERGNYLTLLAQWDEPNSTVILTSEFGSPVELAGGIFVLKQIELTIKVTPATDNEPIFVLAPRIPLKANGGVLWQKEEIMEWPFTVDQLPFKLSYRVDGINPGHFALEFDPFEGQPIIFRRQVLKILNAHLSAVKLPREAVYCLLLTGTAGDEPASARPFLMRQEYVLESLGHPGLPLGTEMSFSPPGAKPPVADEFEMPDWGAAAGAIPGEAVPGGEIAAAAPAPGTETSTTTSLIDEIMNRVVDFFSGVQEKLNWFEQIRLLFKLKDQADLGDFIENKFFNALNDLVTNAEKDEQRPSLERLFRLIFNKVQDNLDDLGADTGKTLQKIWQVWFRRVDQPENSNRLLRLLNVFFEEHSPQLFRQELDALFEVKFPGNLADFMSTGLNLVAGRFDRSFESNFQFWIDLLAGAGRKSEPETLAKALIETLRTASVENKASRSPGDLEQAQQVPELKSSLFNMNLNVLLTALGLQTLTVQSGLAASLGTSTLNTGLKPYFEPLKILPKSIQPGEILISRKNLLRLLHAFVTNAEGDEEMEICLMEMSRFFPLGVLLPVLLALINLLRLRLPWPDMCFKSIEEDDDVATLRLPAPGPGHKYYIFSDIHRDQASDDRGYFEFGSIDHFSENQELYCRILKHALKDEWTVLEVGDCDELWFIRDFNEFRAKGKFAGLLKGIIENHKSVYDVLVELHREGRYYRVFGNHDSHVRKPEIFQILKDRFDDQNLKFYDFIVIPDVKTMDEHDYFDLVFDVLEALKSENKVRTLFERLFDGRLGLDAAAYTSKRPMIVAHGHQWDFWNCDKNSLVGKMFSNSAAVWVDSINDPFLDLGGLAMGGSPILKFADVFSKLPVFNSFLGRQPARRFAHQIQHQHDCERLIEDDVFYFESITALMGMFALPLTVYEQGKPRTWRQTLQGIKKKRLKVTSILDHIRNHICIGHTHYPHSQPYFDIEGWVYSAWLGPVVGHLVDFFKAKVSELLFGYKLHLNILKSYYHNTGTSGWMEGIVWALRIDETGQARLVFWTRDTQPDQPEEMDWDLPIMDEEVRKVLEEKKEKLFKYFEKLPFIMSEQLPEILQGRGVMPMSMVTNFAEKLAVTPGNFTLQLSEEEAGGDQTGESANKPFGLLSQMLLNIFLSLAMRQGEDHSTEQNYEIAVKLPEEVQMELTEMADFVDDFPGAESRRDELACIWSLLRRNLPLNSGRLLSALKMVPSSSKKFPVLDSVIALSVVLPKEDAENGRVSTRLKIESEQLKLKVTLH